MITSVKAHKQLDTTSQVYHLERDLAPYINQAKIHSTHFSYPNSLVVNKLKKSTVSQEDTTRRHSLIFPDHIVNN